MKRADLEQYICLRRTMERRAEELCRIYTRIYYDWEGNDYEIYITNIEIGRSGRILIQFTDSVIEDMLYLPPEYFWLTDDEVMQIMKMDKEKKETAIGRRKATRED